MQMFDASSMIHAWDNYPAGQFPGLWKWMASQIEAKQLVMPNVAFKEVQDKTPDCGKWLRDNNLKQLANDSNVILQDAKRIQELLEIINDQYHPKGVNENDILIIATARFHKVELVSDEARQESLPKVRSKSKIPAVCKMIDPIVHCINFIEYIKRSEKVFR